MPVSQPLAPPPIAPATSLPEAAVDALWHSALPPFARAHRFVERVAQLSPAEWREVLHRAFEVEPGLRTAGLRALTERLVGHPQSRAFGALTRAAHDAVELAGRRGVVPHDTVDRAAGLAARAASAVAMRDELAPAHGLVHYAPFAPVIVPMPAPIAGTVAPA